MLQMHNDVTLRVAAENFRHLAKISRMQGFGDPGEHKSWDTGDLFPHFAHPLSPLVCFMIEWHGRNGVTMTSACVSRGPIPTLWPPEEALPKLRTRGPADVKLLAHASFGRDAHAGLE